MLLSQKKALTVKEKTARDPSPWLAKIQAGTVGEAIFVCRASEDEKQINNRIQNLRNCGKGLTPPVYFSRLNDKESGNVYAILTSEKPKARAPRKPKVEAEGATVTTDAPAA